jgi:hypothetical protein
MHPEEYTCSDELSPFHANVAFSRVKKSNTRVCYEHKEMSELLVRAQERSEESKEGILTNPSSANTRLAMLDSALRDVHERVLRTPTPESTFVEGCFFGLWSLQKDEEAAKVALLYSLSQAVCTLKQDLEALREATAQEQTQNECKYACFPCAILSLWLLKQSFGGSGTNSHRADAEEPEDEHRADQGAYRSSR